MNRSVRFRTLASICLLLSPLTALAGGRTDGPEGSEVGKGGYSRAGAGPFSIEGSWGASFTDGYTGSRRRGAPLFAGLTASYWADNWLLIDVSGFYLFDAERTEVLIGPRFRTDTDPVSFSVGLKAGPIFYQDNVYFGLSPQAGLDLLINDHVIVGLGYAADFAFSAGGSGLSNRVFLNLGYRF